MDRKSIWIIEGQTEDAYKIMSRVIIYFHKNGLRLIPVTSNYIKEKFKKVYDEIFMEGFTKGIEEGKKQVQSKQINVGDEVTIEHSTGEYIVREVNGDSITLMFKNLGAAGIYHKKIITPTGKHYQMVEKLLKELQDK